MKMLTLSLALAFATALSLPDAALAQGDLLQTIRQGGSWIEIPVSGGSGTMQTEAVPTLGLTVSGCLNVWPGHSGEWRFDVRESMNGGRLEATVVPGEGVPFTYRTGLRSRLDVRVRWSEPRDTTLIVWVGFDGVAARADSCAPVYGSGSAAGSSGQAGGSRADGTMNIFPEAGHGRQTAPSLYSEFDMLGRKARTSNDSRNLDPEKMAAGHMADERRVVAWIGRSMVFKGKLTSSEDLTIAGEVEGEVSVREHSLIIGPHADVRANIVAKVVTVHGKVTGTITATDRVSVRETGTVEGSIIAPRLAVDDGAMLRGKLGVGASTPETAAT